MRGRLIFKFLAEFCRLDTFAMATVDPDGAGPLTSGYDPDFKEPVLIDADGDGVPEPYRREHPPVRVPCQVEPEALEALRMTASGNAPSSTIDVILHFRDLERMGLVDGLTGEALIRPSDRVAAFYDTRGQLVQAIRTPPGLYVTQARPFGFGLSLLRPRRNLLKVSLSDRPQARV